MPSASGNISGSFLTPFIWNKLARTLAISENKRESVSLLFRSQKLLNTAGCSYIT